MVEEKKTIAKPAEIVASVMAKLTKFADRRELIIPNDYSIENSLKSAWLVLQETKDKDKKPVLMTCSRSSIANALLDMTVQGLNPGKKQCYFIAYGQTLLCQRSYFGSMAVAERVAGTSDIWAEVVYKGDIFEYEISRNRKNITKHVQKLDNISGDNIIAAYCIIEYTGEKPSYTEIMTIEQIHKSWEKSKMNPDAEGSAHSQFPEEMAKRTVINRACKKIINASSDSHLFKQHFNRSDEARTEEEVAADIKENANQELLELGQGEEVEGTKPGTEEKTVDKTDGKTDEKTEGGKGAKDNKSQETPPGSKTQQSFAKPGF